MSAHVLLNLLNELGIRDKNAWQASHFILFRNEFNKFNNIPDKKETHHYDFPIKISF